MAVFNFNIFSVAVKLMRTGEFNPVELSKVLGARGIHPGVPAVGKYYRLAREYTESFGKAQFLGRRATPGDRSVLHVPYDVKGNMQAVFEVKTEVPETGEEITEHFTVTGETGLSDWQGQFKTREELETMGQEKWEEYQDRAAGKRWQKYRKRLVGMKTVTLKQQVSWEDY